MGGSFEDPSNVETTPSTPTPVLLQSPPFLFAPTLQIQILFAGLDLSSSMLPDSLPPGDPSNFALPVFLIQVSVKKKRKVSQFFSFQPKSTFTSRDTPATLRCRVAHALEVAFDCDGELVKLDKQTEGVDKKTGSKYLEASVKIKKGQVSSKD